MASKLASAIQVNPQDLWVSSTVAQADLGSTAVTPDGRYFRYVKAGELLVAGTLVQCAAEVANHENVAPTANVAVGATSFTVTLGATAATANQYANGWALVTVTPGIGQMLQIASHPAADASATLALTLGDPVKVALTTAASKIDLIANPYAGVIINPASTSGIVGGVAFWALPSATYGWVQVGGVANILNDGGTTVGLAVVASNGTAGAVETLTGTQAPVGIALTGITTAECGAVKLAGIL
jgi:hypothetical protein